MLIDPKDSERHDHKTDGASFQCLVESLFSDEPNPCWPHNDEADSETEQSE
jgi:hypothetical protein